MVPLDYDNAQTKHWMDFHQTWAVHHWDNPRDDEVLITKISLVGGISH